MARPVDIRGALTASLSTGALVACCVLLPGGAAQATPADTVITVSNADELSAALGSAVPGQTISLLDGNYVGKFETTSSGTSSAPIQLVGSRDAVLSTGSIDSGYALHVTNSYWNLTGFSVSTAAKGIVLDNSDFSVLDGVDVGSIGQEAVHVRTSSTDVIIRNSHVHDTGLETPAYGEGIYIGSANSNWESVMGSSSTPDLSDNALIENNTVTNTTAEGIDIKEGTTGGRVTGNVFTNAGNSGENSADSWVDVKGNSYTVSGNSGTSTLLDAFQVHSVLPGWGADNDFSDNTVIGGVSGYEVNIASDGPGNVVHCKASNAVMGLTNVTCG